MFNLAANMLSFSVTIGPNHKCLAVSGLIADVLGDGSLVLRIRQSKQSSALRGYETYLCYTTNYRRSEQRIWRWISPVLLVIGPKVLLHYVAGHARHCDLTVVPWHTKVVIEGVVFDPWHGAVSLY